VSFRRLSAVLPLIMAGLLALPLSTQAGDLDLLPNKVAKPKGDACVEPDDVMRKNHMKFLLHQRDDTLRRGIRTKKYSLNECLECHVQPDENGKVARIDSPNHFCSTCHVYAAVKLDCFECHSDLPKSMNKAAYKHTLSGDDQHHASLKENKAVSKEMLNAIAYEGGESK
jgi:hypothetical protein